MKKILLLIAVNIFIKTCLFAQTVTYLDSSGFSTIFYDGFDYYNSLGVLDFAGTSTTGVFPWSFNPTFTDNWVIQNGAQINSDYALPSQVALSSDPGCPSYLSLIEEPNPNYGLSGVTSAYDHITGMVTQQYFGFSYGIYEIKARFPGSPTGPSVHTPSPALWLWDPMGPATVGTEIDICDGGGWASYIPMRVIDWYYKTALGYPYNYEASYTATNTVLGPLGISDLSGWHLYTVMWDPEYVFFFVDNKFVTAIYYSEARTYPEPMSAIIEMILWTNSTTTGPQELDIDWVKIMRKDCTSGSFNIPALVDPLTSAIVPNMYKATALSGSSSTLVATDPLNPTLFVSPSTTIESNFIADETNPVTGFYPLAPYTGSGMPPSDVLYESIPNYIYGPIHKNSFFEVVACDCSNSPTEGGYRIASTNTSDNPKNSIATANWFNNFMSIGNDTTAQAQGYNQIQVYPNPTQNNVTISYPCNLSGQLEIKISDVAGQIRYTESVNCTEDNSVQQTVDMSAFSPGVYFIDLTLNDQHVVKKIVKL